MQNNDSWSISKEVRWTIFPPFFSSVKEHTDGNLLFLELLTATRFFLQKDTNTHTQDYTDQKKLQ